MNSSEFEWKQLLTSSEYDELLNVFNKYNVCNEVTQINYYYDDNNFSLYNKNETLRVRQKLNNLSLERKFNKHYYPYGLRICNESSECIQKLPLSIACDGNEYYYLGNLVTVRKNYMVDKDIISLDINYYLGQVDYEIEIESLGADRIPSFIDKIISFSEPQEGKYKRFVCKLRSGGERYEL